MVLFVAVVVACGPGARVGHTPAATLVVAPPDRAGWADFESLVDRLSTDLRTQRLSEVERGALRRRGAGNESLRAIYHSYVDRWLDAAFYRNFFDGYLPAVKPEGLFVPPLARYRIDAGETWLYYIPETVPGPRDRAPCRPEERVWVHPWWNISTEVLVCRRDAAPERLYDAIGVCSGQPEPTLPVPARASCGCGPLLAACLPPREERPQLLEALQHDIQAEARETAVDIALRGQSFDGLMTASTTWQTGLVEFLYLRRQLMRDVGDGIWSAARERDYIRRVGALDLTASRGRWVRRAKGYEGTGLHFTTIEAQATFPTYRTMMRRALGWYLCVEFDSIHVDSQALLATVGDDHEGLRAFAVHESPMRLQNGCKSCHAPMDYGAGFLHGFRTPLFGSVATGEVADGKLYVKGARATTAARARALPHLRP